MLLLLQQHPECSESVLWQVGSDCACLHSRVSHDIIKLTTPQPQDAETPIYTSASEPVHARSPLHTQPRHLHWQLNGRVGKEGTFTISVPSARARALILEARSLSPSRQADFLAQPLNLTFQARH